MFRKRLLGGVGTAFLGALCLAALVLAAPADTPVADAAMQGDIDTVRSLLRQGMDVNAAQGDGMTALHWAAFTDNVDIARMLSYAGANMEAATRINAMTPLVLAARNGSGAMVAALIEGGADANGTMATGTTPLMFAAAAGSFGAVEALLDAGADANATEIAQGQTPLMFAASYDRGGVIKILVDRGADVSMTTKVVDMSNRGRGFGQRNQGGGGQQAAQARGGRGARGGAAPDDTPDDPSRFLSASGLPAQSAPGSVIRQRETLTAAAPAGRGRGDRNSRITTLGGMTSLLFAAREGFTDAADALLAAGADINQVSPGDKSTALLVATINGHFDLAMHLLERGADPTLASAQGATPLYTTINVRWAPEAGYPQPEWQQNETTYLELMQALIDRGADVDARLANELWYTAYTFDLSRVNPSGSTAFWRAAQVVDIDAMKFLIANGADTEIATNDNVKPIHVATGGGVHGNDEIIAPTGWLAGVEFLVEVAGADVNAKDDSLLTPLHNAASIGETELCEYLVSKGSDISAVSERGETVADMANGPRQRIQPFPETLAFLLSMGSPFNDKCVSC